MLINYVVSAIQYIYLQRHLYLRSVNSVISLAEGI